MAEEKKYKCLNCKMVITMASGVTVPPNPKQGGPCPNNQSGNHSWTSQR
jgi:hypothetical protein